MAKKIVVVGGGPAGMMAAITAKEENKENEVILLERNTDLGKKLLLTGNGKCNLSNENLSVSRYNEDETGILKDILYGFDTDALIEFFMESGLLTQCVNEGIYPYTNQSKTVLDVLKIRLNEAGVDIICNAYLNKVQKKDGNYLITYLDEEQKETEISCDALILACGGKAAPSTGSDGNSFKFARELGLEVSKTYPVLVQLLSDFNKRKELSGVRCRASVQGFYKEDNDLKHTNEHFGILQITDYGISGIVVFNLSRELSVALEEGRECEVIIDFLPDYSSEELRSFVSIRWKNCENLTISEFLTGLLNEKLISYLLKANKVNKEDQVHSYSADDLFHIIQSFKVLRIPISGHHGYNNAQATKGGVLLKNLSMNLESLKNPGLYFAGEMLDVDGECGGYNLQWAFASGYRAGKNAGSSLNEESGKESDS